MSNQEYPREFTFLAFIVGSLLSVLLTASNTYLGLKAGMTISASIPAAVASMLVLKGILKRGTIFENNIVQTLVSTGESLAAGVIFTIPALIIMGIWDHFDYWSITLISILGGIMGALLMVPLRKTLIIDREDLVYPEGVATAEVLIVGHRGVKTGILLIWGIVIGMGYKLLTSFFVIFKGSVMSGIKIWKTAFIFGFEASAALTGIGFIIGPRISTLVFVGAVTGWTIVLPLYIIFTGYVIPDNFVAAITSELTLKVRFVGMGTMLVAGIWTIYSIRDSIKDALAFAAQGLFKKGKLIDKEEDRTKINLPFSTLYGGVVVVLIGMFFMFSYQTNSIGIGLISAILILIAAFFFVAVSSYIVGLVGSSSNPVSGMILTSLIFTSLVLLAFKQTGTKGMLAAILIGGTIGIAAAVAGDMSQDLKSGQIIGATPYKQQLAQIIGCIIPAFVVVPILNLLHNAYTLGSDALAAPQAGLMKMVVEGILGNGTLDLKLIGVGALVGVIIIMLKLPAMPVAVGIYLPFTTSACIFIGGLLNAFVKFLITKRYGKDMVKDGINNGILLSSGLIAGEALIGILLAGVIVSGINPLQIFNSTLLTIISFIALMLIFVYLSSKALKEKK